MPSVLSVVSSEFDRVVGMKLPPATVVGATGSVAYSCATGLQTTVGSANSETYTVTYSNANTLSAGDTVTISYNNCVYSGSTITLNGSMTLAINTLVGGPAIFTSSGFTTTFNNFTFSNTSETVAMNGNMSIAASLSGNVVTSTISGSSLVISDTIGSSTNSIKLYGAGGYNITYTRDNITTAYTYSANMQVASTAMNGSVTIATPTTFQGTGAGDPSVGVMTVSGSNGSSVTLKALSSTSVELSGTDGTTAFGPTTVAWSSL